MKKLRFFSLTFALILLFCACTAQTESAPELNRYSAQFLTLFHTVTTVVGYAKTEEEFSATAQRLHDELEEYHKLYDIYKTYEGIANLKTINDMAGVAPVEVDRRILDLLLFCRELCKETGGLVDITMGSVLLLWNEARTLGVKDSENAALPEDAALKEAAAHTGFENLIIDEERCTVYLADPDARLDVGAVAKGYAVEQVCRSLPSGLLVSVGGNVRATGPNPATGKPWVVGVQNPDGETGDYLHTLLVDDDSVVTSGDYQRYYTVNGRRYHHIIDPETLYPAERWRAVTVLCGNSGLADVLSTALFLLSEEDGRKLLDRFDAEAVWVGADGELTYSNGFSKYIRTESEKCEKGPAFLPFSHF